MYRRPSLFTHLALSLAVDRQSNSEQKYVSHAKEMSLEIPTVPTLFLKPSSSLADPFPAPTVLPKITQADGTGDYEAEMVIVLGREAKDVNEAEAMEYVLGYTAANDVSSRTSQMNQSQWCFSKGFDGSCPIGEFTQPLFFDSPEKGRSEIEWMKMN
jgi:2-keto-4-pentenoate hydratase/2-oxohepta-3-ene-1,7-dioic acid hydratase in catechol pathway